LYLQLHCDRTPASSSTISQVVQQIGTGIRPHF
jgi:hypothetical protein